MFGTRCGPPEETSHVDVHRRAGSTGWQRAGIRDEDALCCTKVREEPGDHVYIVHRLQDNPRVFMYYEGYTDQAALEAHCQHLRESGVELRAVLDSSAAPNRSKSS
jgi:quinol monooxygenase YgiN